MGKSNDDERKKSCLRFPQLDICTLHLLRHMQARHLPMPFTRAHCSRPTNVALSKVPAILCPIPGLLPPLIISLTNLLKRKFERGPTSLPSRTYHSTLHFPRPHHNKLRFSGRLNSSTLRQLSREFSLSLSMSCLTVFDPCSAIHFSMPFSRSASLPCTSLTTI